jgi:truncated hemoglobin YjbI
MQQTDFMAGALGGPNVYCGRLHVAAHEHILITEESFEVRNVLLRESLEEAGIAQEVADAWMRVEDAFRKSIVRTRLDECQKRHFTDEILDFPNPLRKAS